MREWQYQIDLQPPLDEAPGPDPADWECSLHLVNDTEETEEVIHIVFTGTLDADDNTVPTPEEEVLARLKSMIRGLDMDDR